MASIIREIEVENSAAKVWAAIADFHAVDKKVAPGFVMSSVPDGRARIVTFESGLTAREFLVTSDANRRRLVYAIRNERLQHYNASLEVTELDTNRSRLVWTVDLLPDDMAQYIDQQMNLGVRSMKTALESAS